MFRVEVEAFYLGIPGYNTEVELAILKTYIEKKNIFQSVGR